MTRVSYQGMLDHRPGGGGGGVYVRLGADTIATRRKDARRTIKVSVSPAQQRWLREVEGITGDGIDADMVVRALIDLGMELDIDWPLLARGKVLRAAVRESVMVHRPPRG